MGGPFLLILLTGCVDLRRPDMVTLIDADVPLDGPGGDNEDAAAPEDGPLEDDGIREVDTAPDPQPLGARCARGEHCLSGVCARGTCCAEACNGLCMACNLAGSEGSCKPVPAGEDPAAECPQQQLTTCGLDGTCDGRGRCRRYPASTECRPGHCTAGVEYAATACDGTGAVCPDQTVSTTCTSGMCTGDSCAAPCADDAGCQSGFYCAAGAARPSWPPEPPAAAQACARLDSASTASAAAAPAPRPVSPATSPARRAPARRSPAARTRARSARPRGRRPAGGPAAATAAAPAGCTRPTPSASAAAAAAPPRRPPAPATAWASAARPGPVATARPTPAGPPPAPPPAPIRPSCAPGFSCSARAPACAAPACILLLALRGDQRVDRRRQLGQRPQRQPTSATAGAPTSSTNLPALVHSNAPQPPVHRVRAGRRCRSRTGRRRCA